MSWKKLALLGNGRHELWRAMDELLGLRARSGHDAWGEALLTLQGDALELGLLESAGERVAIALVAQEPWHDATIELAVRDAALVLFASHDVANDATYLERVRSLAPRVEVVAPAALVPSCRKELAGSWTRLETWPADFPFLPAAFPACYGGDVRGHGPGGEPLRGDIPT